MKRILSIACLSTGLAMVAAAPIHLKVANGEGTDNFRPVVAAIYQEIGLVPDFVSVPLARALAGVESGEYDAEAGRAPEAASGLTNVVFTTVSIFDLRLLAVYRDGFASAPVTAADLGKYRLVKVRGAKLADTFIDQARLRSETVNYTVTLARFLKGGRADIGLIVSVSPLSLAGEDAQGLTTQKEALLTSKIYHVFNRRYAQYASLWDAALTVMLKDGRIAKLLESATK